MQGEQGWKHPGVCVPENHAGIAVAREARRPQTGGAIRGDAGIERVLIGADSLLESRIAIYINIGVPDGIPCGAILLLESGKAPVSSLLRFLACVSLRS